MNSKTNVFSIENTQEKVFKGDENDDIESEGANSMFGFNNRSKSLGKLPQRMNKQLLLEGTGGDFTLYYHHWR